MSKDKNNFLSTAKGIGIILMVMGHSGVPGDIDKFIYQFHMPLFFFCSGYFLNNCENFNSIVTIIKKRFKGIYLKFLCWSILFLALHNVFIYLNIYNDTITKWAVYPYNINDFVHRAIKIIFSMNGHEQLVRSFWFFKQLFLASIIVPSIIYITNKITHHKHAHLFVFMGLFLMTLISKYFNWALPAIWDISLVFMSSTFYLSGYIFRKYNLLTKLNNITTSFLFFSFLIIGLVYLPWTNMLVFTIITAIPFFIVAFSGTVLTLNISQVIESYKIKYLFYYLGQNTLVIFALHMLCFKIGNLLKILIYNYPMNRLAEFQIILDNNILFWIIYTIIGITVPLFINYLMKKNIITKRIWNYFV
jgi:fucose 4-O-acetylase-like acetyltransferase